MTHSEELTFFQQTHLSLHCIRTRILLMTIQFKPPGRQFP